MFLIGRLIFCAFGVKLKAGKTQFSRKTQRIFGKLNQNFSKTQFCETFVLKRRTVLLQKYVFKKKSLMQCLNTTYLVKNCITLIYKTQAKLAKTHGFFSKTQGFFTKTQENSPKTQFCESFLPRPTQDSAQKISLIHGGIRKVQQSKSQTSYCRT